MKKGVTNYINISSFIKLYQRTIFLILILLSYNSFSQGIKLDAGNDLDLTCFDEVRINAQITNWNIGSKWDNGIKSIEIINDSSAIAVGRNLILKTDDLGKNWTKIDSFISNNLNKVTFVDKKKGFIVSEEYSRGNILRSTDGGESWDSIYTTSSYQGLRSIDFANDSVGFAVGSGLVLKTNNSGENWEIVTCPTYSYYDILFIDNLTGFIIGKTDNAFDDRGRMIITLDGGDTWNEIDLEFCYGLLGITAINNKIFISTEEGMVISSEDLFDTWDIKHTGSSSDLYDIVFFTEDSGVTVGRKSTIFITNDGGKNWIREFSDYKDAEIFSIASFNDTVKIAVGGIQNKADGAIIRYTNIPEDISVKWNPSTYLSDPNVLTPAVYPLEDTQYIIKVTSSSGIDITDTLNISVRDPNIYIGEDTTIYKNDTLSLFALTEIGNWEVASDESRVWFEDVKFINRDTGFIAGSQRSGTVMKTIDGGKTWFKKITNARYGLKEISFPDDSVGYVVGSMGQMFKTINGGETWTSLPTINETHWNTVCFVNQDIGYVGGEDGKIFKTMDGGQSWQAKSIGTSYDIEKIYFIDEQRGFVLPETNWDFTFINTFDGGNTWTKVKVPEHYIGVNDIQFINDTIGFMIGGTLRPMQFLKTIDGGMTWDVYRFQRYHYPIYSSIFFTDEFTGYVCNSIGEIIKTVDGGKSWYIWNTFNTDLTSLYFRDNNNAIVVGTALIGKYHAPSDIYYNWLPNSDITYTNLPYTSVFPKIPTVYQIEAYNEIGCSVLDEISIEVNDTTSTTTSTTEFSEIDNKQIRVYPNPVTDNFYVSFENVPNGDYNLIMYNSEGYECFRDIFHKEYNTKYQIVNAFNPGIYVLNIVDAKKNLIVSKKIIIN